MRDRLDELYDIYLEQIVEAIKDNEPQNVREMIPSISDEAENLEEFQQFRKDLKALLEKNKQAGSKPEASVNRILDAAELQLKAKFQSTNSK